MTAGLAVLTARLHQNSTIRSSPLIQSLAIVIYSFFVIRETQGVSLEGMEVLFGNIDRMPGKDVDLEIANRESAEAPREIHESTK